MQVAGVTGGHKEIAYIESVQKHRNLSANCMYDDQPQQSDVDPRSDQVFRAWGCRRAPKTSLGPSQQRPASAGGVASGGLPSYHTYAPGRINPRSLTRIARMPSSAYDTDPIHREPMRAAGGHTFLMPYHMQYQYYKSYGNGGCHDLTSAHHNFPFGDVPVPQRIYGGRPECHVTKVRNTRPKTYATVGVATDRTMASPLYSVPQRQQ